MLPISRLSIQSADEEEFQWAPTLGGECYAIVVCDCANDYQDRFNGHPPLGVNATHAPYAEEFVDPLLFQWAPTLGGECYKDTFPHQIYGAEFQWAPTLGGECYTCAYP